MKKQIISVLVLCATSTLGSEQLEQYNKYFNEQADMIGQGADQCNGNEQCLNTIQKVGALNEAKRVLIHDCIQAGPEACTINDNGGHPNSVNFGDREIVAEIKANENNELITNYGDLTTGNVYSSTQYAFDPSQDPNPVQDPSLLSRWQRSAKTDAETEVTSATATANVTSENTSNPEQTQTDPNALTPPTEEERNRVPASESGANVASVTPTIEKILERVNGVTPFDKELEATYKGTRNFETCQKSLELAGTTFEDVTLSVGEVSQHEANFLGAALSITKTELLRQIGLTSELTKADILPANYKQLSEGDPKKALIKKILGSAANKALKSTRQCILFAKTATDNFKEKRHKDSDYTKPEEVKSFDQRLKCNSEGLETIDYDECRQMIMVYNGSKIVTEANNVRQTFQAQSYGQKANEQLMNMDPTADNSTKALEVQSEGKEKEQGMAQETGTLHSTKAAAMLGYATQLPDHDDVKKLCASNDDMGTYMSHLTSFYDKVIPKLTNNLRETSSEEQCRLAFENGRHGILQNSGQKTTAAAIAAEAGVEAAKNFMLADVLGDQKKMIDGTIDKIKGMETIDLPEDAFQNPELVTFCNANPNAQECVGFGTGMTTHVTGGGLSFNGGLATNETLNPTVGNDDSATAITDGSATDRQETNIPTSRAIASVDKGSGFTDATPGKAKVSSSPAAGGGGGSGGGAGGGGGLSGSGPSAGGKGVAPGSGSRKFKLGYSGGNRPLSFRGGRSKSRKSSKTVGNPFSKMLGKKGAKGNDVFNFRGLASKGLGGKDGNLFERISKSYDSMNKKNRLIKYKISE